MKEAVFIVAVFVMIFFSSLVSAQECPLSADARTSVYPGGDVNKDGKMDISDSVDVLNFLFRGGQIKCLTAADVNGDGTVSISDPIYSLKHLFQGGPAPKRGSVSDEACSRLYPKEGDITIEGNIRDVNIRGWEHISDDIFCIDRTRNRFIVNDIGSCQIPIVTEGQTGGPGGPISYVYLGCASDGQEDVIFYKKNFDCILGTDNFIVLPSLDVINDPSSSLRGIGMNRMLIGGAGNDYIEGVSIEGKDNDLIRGMPGDDILFGGTGQDTLRGGKGNDELYAGQGDDNLYASQRDDTISGDERGDKLYGGMGNDYIFDGAGDDILCGGDGIDHIYGNTGIDAFFGGKGDDILSADSYDELSRINNDPIVAFGNEGEDIILGGKGDDILSQGGMDDDNSAVKIIGNGGNDIILGSNKGETLYGDGFSLAEAEEIHPGNDLIFGDIGELESVLPQGLSSSNLNGAKIYSLALQGVRNLPEYQTLLQHQLPQENAGGPDKIWGGCGNDLILGGGGDDKIYGLSDSLILPSVPCDQDNDMLYGGSGDDEVFGAIGDDIIYGGGGKDLLFGDREEEIKGEKNGKDYVCGGADDDRIFGDTREIIREGVMRGAQDFLVAGPRQQKDYVCDSGRRDRGGGQYVCDGYYYGFSDEDYFTLNGPGFNPYNEDSDINDYSGSDGWKGEKLCRDNWAIGDEGEKCMLTGSHVWGPIVPNSAEEIGTEIAEKQGKIKDTEEEFLTIKIGEDSFSSIKLPDCGVYGPSGLGPLFGGLYECKTEKDICCVCEEFCGQPLPGPRCVPRDQEISCGDVGILEATLDRIEQGTYARYVEKDVRECNYLIHIGG